MVVVAAFAVGAAFVCLALAFLSPANDVRASALVVALLLMVLAAGATAVDEKVAAGGGGSRNDPESTANVSIGEKDLAAFASVEELQSGPLPKDLCLVRYYQRNVGPAGKWWTTCDQASSLKTVALVRQFLAVKRQWGTYDTSIRYTVRAGTRVFYARGRAAEQCSPGAKRCLYRGGGVQFFFPAGLDPVGGVNRRCAVPSAASATTPAAADAATYRPCP